VLPLLLSLARDPGAYRGLVLTPSRELALQVKETMVAVAGRAGAGAGGAQHLSGTRVITLTGGYPIIDQLKQLAAKPHVIVATPGRLAQIVRQGLGGSGGGATNQPTERDNAAVSTDQRAITELIAADSTVQDQFAAVVRSLKRCHILVLDEADRLLSSEFAADIATILAALPKPAATTTTTTTATTTTTTTTPRQTLLFSATMTKNMHKLAQVGLATSAIIYDGSAPKQLSSDTTAQSVSAPTTNTFVVSPNILQQYIFLPQNVKDCYLVFLIRSFFGLRPSAKLDSDKERRTVSTATAHHMKRSPNNSSASLQNNAGDGQGQPDAQPRFIGDADGQILVFVRSCVLCEEIAAMLQELGIPTCRLHAWMKQPERKQALERFKSGLCRVMVATDVAHRGLDIQLCRLVIQYNLPQTTTEYVHRVGRTGRTHSRLDLDDSTTSSTSLRASSTGQAIALLDQYEVKMLLTIERDIGQKLAEFKTSENVVLAHLNDAITARELGRLRLDESGFYETAERIRQRKQAGAEIQANNSLSNRLQAAKRGPPASSSPGSNTAATSSLPKKRKVS
jgi:ATP-dependent RNA helicase DDX49/DBP8